MYNSKILLLIKNLTEDELFSFKTYLQDKHRDQISYKIFISILKHRPNFEKAQLKKEKLFKTIFPNKIYNDTNFRFHQSHLLKLLEEFLLDQVPRTQAEKLQILLKFYKQKEVDKLFLNKLEAFKKLNDDYEIRDENYYLNSLQIENEYNSYATKTAQTSKRYSELQNDQITAIDKYYHLAKIKQICSSLNYKQTFKNQEKVYFQDEIIEELGKNIILLKEPSIALYYQVYQTLIEPEKIVHFNQLNLELYHKAKHLSPEDARDLFIYAQNYCIRKINQGESSFLEILFSLYQKGIETKSIYQHDKLSPWDYKNIVSLGLRLKKMDWTLKFIHQEKESMDERERENAFTYNLANYHFSAQEYSEAIQLLLSIEYTDVFYQLGAKIILLKSYYELDEYDALLSLMDSFKILLLRKKEISKSNQVLYLNFLKILKQFLKLASNKSKKQDLLSQIQATSPLADRSWLILKCQEL